MESINSLAALWLVGLAAMVAAGCGKKIPLGEVEGTVRLDGRPLESVAVTFLPDHAQGTAGPHSNGRTDALGHYRLRCQDSRPGAPVGWHRVTVEDLLPYTVPRDDDTPTARAPKFRVPAVYADPAKTPIRAEVGPGRQTIDLELTSTGSPHGG